MSHQCPGTCDGTLVTDDSLLMCAPCWRQVAKPVQRAVHRAWAHGAGKGTRAHLAACEAAVRSLGREPEPPPPRPAPHELWAEAGEDPEEYHRLMIEHGHLIGPGHPRYEEAVQAQAEGCGWRPEAGSG